VSFGLQLLLGTSLYKNDRNSTNNFSKKGKKKEKKMYEEKA
jgi:hypothetical protein